MISVLFRSNFLKTGRCLTQIQPHVRQSSILFNLINRGESHPIIDKSDYKVIYHFPYIGFLAGVIKFKYFFALGSAITIPVAFYLDDNFKLPIFVTILCVLQLGILFKISRLLNNIVGKIYVNGKGEVKEILISSVNHKGKRVDTIYPLSDIFVNDYSAIFEKLGFAVIKSTDKDMLYKLNVSSGQFMNYEICSTLFGHLTLYQYKKK